MAQKLTHNQELGLLLASMGFPNDTGLSQEEAYKIGSQYFKENSFSENEEDTI